MRRVTQVEAKRGDFIESYETRQAFELACPRLEKAAKRAGINRELVYIILPVGHKVIWQVFLMP
jgi:hypothetical protein